MTTSSLILQSWSANPVVLLGCALATIAYGWAFRGRARWGAFLAAIAVVALTLLSPLNALAERVLFSAHMVQHIFLLLIAPALLLASLPRDVSLPLSSGSKRWLPALGWAGGVGSMWFWHVPEFCNAAATSATVHAGQTLSLLVMGTAFWWPVFAPQPRDRLPPGVGIGYLFTACLACTALGIILTFAPIRACPIYRVPLEAGNAWNAVRAAVTAERDQQIGGLLMWVPMCLLYVGGIVIELFRLLGGHEARPRRPEATS